MSVNRVTLLGNLGADPETREAGSATVCSVRVATTQKYKNRDGEQKEETQWHDIEAWGRLGELVQQYCRKGSRVYVEGELRYRVYEKDGVKRKATSIRAATVQFLDSRGEGSKGHSNGQGEDEDVPF